MAGHDSGDETKPLLELIEPESGRRIRIEAPTVFGRAPTLHDYAGQEGRAFGADLLAELTRLDFVRIGGLSTSRTHCLLQPQTEPSVQDLNSRNGVSVNGQSIPPTDAEGVGSVFPLSHGDLVEIGDLTFIVHSELDEQAALEALWSHRYALAAPAHDPQLTGAVDLLRSSRHFSTRLASTWQELDSEFARLVVASHLDCSGICLIALHLEVEGLTVSLGGQTRQAEHLIKNLNAIHGSKMLAIQAEGDPSALERCFRDEAQRDALLLTTTLPDAALFADGVEEDLASPILERAAGGRASPRQLAAYHGLFDGLEALIPVRSNLLDLAWYQHYEGALSLTSGTKPPPDDEQIEISYVLRDDGSAPMSWRTYSF